MRTPSTQQHDTYTYTQGYLLSAIGYRLWRRHNGLYFSLCLLHRAHVARVLHTRTMALMYDRRRSKGHQMTSMRMS
jgi:hypothetical protein